MAAWADDRDDDRALPKESRTLTEASGTESGLNEAAFGEGFEAGLRWFASRFAQPERQPPHDLADSGSPTERLLSSALAVAQDAAWTLAASATATLTGIFRALAAAYDGDATGVMYGSPVEARAWRELREHGDVEHFLRVFAPDRHRGEPGLAERIQGFPLPVAEFAAVASRRDARRMTSQEAGGAGLTGAPGERAHDPPCFDWMTLPELTDWRRAWADAAFTVAEFIRGRVEESEIAVLARGARETEAELVAELDPADLLLVAASAPRGFAARDEELYRQLQAIRKRLRRHREKSRAAVSE
jgi:hypothetical protein